MCGRSGGGGGGGDAGGGSDGGGDHGKEGLVMAVSMNDSMKHHKGRDAGEV